MSIAAYNRVWGIKFGDATRKLVMLKYADHAHADGRNTWASPASVAEFAECSKRTVQRILADLLAEGYMREGDQAQYVGELPPRYRPIVYDIAMDEATRLMWKAEREATGGGVRDFHADHGAKGGRRSAEVRAAARGDNLTPLGGANAEEKEQVNRGDSLAPLGCESEVRGDTEPTSGVTNPAFRGDTQVSHEPPPQTQPLNLPSSEPSLRSGSAAASDDTQQALIEGPAKPKRARKAKDDDPEAATRSSLANTIARDWISGWEAKRNNGQTLVGQQRKLFAVRGMVLDALTAGRTETQVKTALRTYWEQAGQGGTPVPSAAQWSRLMDNGGNVVDLRGGNRPARTAAQPTWAQGVQVDAGSLRFDDDAPEAATAAAGGRS